ncbi:MAG: AMP-binding protein [Candidatus Melainabacteria bacterium]|nr:AMP-binding protein [Candidatus Melainabacteria bacterium]
MTQVFNSSSPAFVDESLGCTQPALMPLFDFSPERPNLATAFLKKALRNIDKSAVSDESGTLTYRQLLDRVLTFAIVMQPRLKANDRVAILLPPSILAVTANLALTIIGKVVVNFNYGTANEIVNCTIANAGIEQVVTCSSFLEQVNLELLAELLDMRRMRSWEDSTVRLRVQSLLANPVISRFEYEFAGLSADLSDIAAVLYTSGSTGKPKGVELSHRSILSNVQATLQQYPPRLLSSGAVEDETIIGAVTFAHFLGYTGTLWVPVLLGLRALYITNPLDVISVSRTLEQHNVTLFLFGSTGKVEVQRFKATAIEHSGH